MEDDEDYLKALKRELERALAGVNQRLERKRVQAVKPLRVSPTQRPRVSVEEHARAIAGYHSPEDSAAIHTMKEAIESATDPDTRAQLRVVLTERVTLANRRWKKAYRAASEYRRRCIQRGEPDPFNQRLE